MRHCDIHPASFSDRQFDEPAHFAHITDVTARANTPAATFGADFLSGLLRAFSVDVVQDDRCALKCELTGNLVTDPFAGTCDDGNLVVKGHVTSNFLNASTCPRMARSVGNLSMLEAP